MFSLVCVCVCDSVHRGGGWLSSPLGQVGMGHALHPQSTPLSPRVSSVGDPPLPSQVSYPLTFPSQSGRVVYSAVLAACGMDSYGFEPQTSTNACGHVCRYVDQKAWLPYWPLYSQLVSHQRWIWGSHKWESMQKGSTMALKPRADITRSPKQGYQWPHEKDLCPPKIENLKK